VIARSEALLSGRGKKSTAAARAALHDLLDAVADLLVGGERDAGTWVMFIMREQANPTSAFDVICERAVGRIAGACMALVAKALGGSLDDPAVRVRGFAVLGQLVAFRAARGAAPRSLAWPDFKGARLSILKRAMKAHTDAALR
jgi:TetR/AcrR family transcriptional regulator, regulator of cefoperazone and chloramphenicol sensitivity